MPVVHQFAYGVVNPIIAFFLAFVGSLFGLTCTARARSARSPARRARWLALAALAIGGGGTWLAHFMAMLGFDIPAAELRYSAGLTAGSLAIAVIVVASGMFLVGWGRPSTPKVFLGGLVTGSGVAAMHYTGMAALRFDGTISYNISRVLASVLIAVAAATIALWFTVSARGWKAITGASSIMAGAMCVMHYVGMTAGRVHLAANQTAAIPDGLSPMSLVVPIIVVGAAAAMGLIFAAMSMMGDEDFHESVPRGNRAPRMTNQPVSPAPQEPGRRAGRIRTDVPDIPNPVSLRDFDAQHRSAALRSHRGR